MKNLQGLVQLSRFMNRTVKPTSTFYTFSSTNGVGGVNDYRKKVHKKAPATNTWPGLTRVLFSTCFSVA
ncbi:hypothetical protein P886_3262 [Alteromonadaceae bacterium 2753L.S.0a.02]|nr:hypothetical protein P886_3262 [Alteromonadaceae bacterium 2753L.S.0a.02]